LANCRPINLQELGKSANSAKSPVTQGHLATTDGAALSGQKVQKDQKKREKIRKDNQRAS
jgi:hypothetical protein